MIARILLLLAAWLGITTAIDGLKVNLHYSGPPDVVSLADLQKPGLDLPRFVHIQDAEADGGVCLTTTWSGGEEKTSSDKSYVPIFDATQIDSLARGKPVVVNVLAKTSHCQTDSAGMLLQGVLSSDSIDTTVRDKFKESNILVGDHALLLDPMYAPPSSGGNILLLLGSLLAGLAAIVPFFKREKWPKEKELDGQNLPEMLDAMHPVLQANMRTEWKLDQKSADTPEVVLLKINCVNSSKRPSLAILTNKRYLLYRTNIQAGLIFLKVVGRCIEKIPVLGGFAAMLVEPFEESYEIILSPEERRFHESMGYDDKTLLSGHVPWHKTCEITLADIPKRAASLKIQKKTWSHGIDVLFMPYSFKGVFKTPSDFIILQEASFVPLSKLVETLKPTFASYGCVVEQTDKKVAISWPHVSQ